MRIYDRYMALIDSYLKNRDFPVFDTDKRIEFYTEYPLFMFAPKKIKNGQRVKIDNIFGDNWAFEAKERRGSYPQYNKLIDLLRGFTRTENHWHYGKKIPPVPLVRIMGKYYLDEGNHRLYISKMLGRKTIVADVIDVNYEYFLKNSYLVEETNYCYVVYDGEAYEVSQTEVKMYKSKKKA